MKTPARILLALMIAAGAAMAPTLASCHHDADMPVNHKSESPAVGAASESDHAVALPSKDYKSDTVPTPNITPGVNDVQGVILHHTAEPTAQSSLEKLTQGLGGKLSRTDRYRRHRCVLAEPNEITWHAGKSMLNGRENCNRFTVGIEFQGNTAEAPLTEDQIASAVQYLTPIMEQYHIPIENVVSHEYIRDQYKKAHPGANVSPKIDVSPDQRERVVAALQKSIKDR